MVVVGGQDVRKVLDQETSVLLFISLSPECVEGCQGRWVPIPWVASGSLLYLSRRRSWRVFRLVIIYHPGGVAEDLIRSGCCRKTKPI